MRILTCLNYYTPHNSGLTVYAQRLNEALVQRGHSVTVLTSRHADDLPYRENIGGVEVYRTRPLVRLNKGLLMPMYPLRAALLARRNDVVQLHLPQWEAGVVAAFVRGLVRRPVVIMYHCDIQLPQFPLSQLFDRALSVAHWAARGLANRVVASTDDYARHSNFLMSAGDKLSFVYPPVPSPNNHQQPSPSIREEYGLQGYRLVGFASRFAADKGIDHLLRAVPLVCQELPNTKFLLAGEYQQVVGEDVYRHVRELLEQNRENVILLGWLPAEKLDAFFSELDLLVVSSINSTESFGLVQVEAMLHGTPVVSTSLPGVRVPIQVTGMGELVPPRDESALATAIIRVLSHREQYVKPRAVIEEIFSLSATIDFYESLYEEEVAASKR